MGGQCCFRLARGGVIFFQQLIGGVSIFYILQGVLSVLLQMGLLLRNKLISKMQVVKMDNPVKRILSKNFIALIFHTLIKHKSRSARLQRQHS